MAVEQKEILEKVTEALAKMLMIDRVNIQPESTLVEDLGMDSYYAVELLFELEDQYNIEIPDEAAYELKKVSDIVTYLHTRLAEPSSG